MSRTKQRALKPGGQNMLKRRRILSTEPLESRRVLASSLGLEDPADVFLSPAHNRAHPADVNGDGTTSPLDALVVINSINQGKTVAEVDSKCDTNGDWVLSAMDALQVITELNIAARVGEGLAQAVDSPPVLPGLTGLALGSGGFLDTAVDSFFNSFDANDDAALTSDEIPPFVWNYLSRRGVDADGDDQITLSEIDTSLEEYRLKRFQSIDTNADGLLTADEVPGFAWDRLVSADANADSGVSFEELEAYRTLTRFQRLDANSDSTITQDEVSERLWNRLSRFDTDQDGGVSEAELPSLPDGSNRISRLADLAARIFQRIRPWI